MYTKRAAIEFAPHSNSAYIIVSMAFHSHVCVHACAAALTESERSGDTLGQSAPHLDLCGLVGHRDKEPPELSHEREGWMDRGTEGKGKGGEGQKNRGKRKGGRGKRKGGRVQGREGGGEGGREGSSSGQRGRSGGAPTGHWVVWLAAEHEPLAGAPLWGVAA